MKTLISTEKLSNAAFNVTVGSAVRGVDARPMTVKAHIFDGRLHYKVVDAFAYINDEFEHTRFNPYIHALIRHSRHTTGTVLCTNVGVFADVVALKHLVSDHFILGEGRSERAYQVTDQGALHSLLDQSDMTGTDYQAATCQVNEALFREISPTKLFYDRNRPEERAPVVRAAKRTAKHTASIEQPNVTAVADAETAQPVEPTYTSVPVEGIAALIAQLCMGRKLSINVSVTLD